MADAAAALRAVRFRRDGRDATRRRTPVVFRGERAVITDVAPRSNARGFCIQRGPLVCGERPIEELNFFRRCRPSSIPGGQVLGDKVRGLMGEQMNVDRYDLSYIFD